MSGLRSDGVVINGRSTVNQAPITGESLPVDKAEGDNVFAGTINEAGSLEYRVTAEASHSTWPASSTRSNRPRAQPRAHQRFVDQFARIYTPVVFAVALLVAIVPPLTFDGAWMDWIYKALVLLVIACPCALVISTPVTIVSGLAAAARKGILVKGGVYLEEGRKLATLALDKTGTITHGKPAQTDFMVLSGDANEAHIPAGSLAARSDHPVSLAIARAAVEMGWVLREVADFAAIPGRGVRAALMVISINSATIDWSRNSACSPEIEKDAGRTRAPGQDGGVVADQTGVLAIFAVADTLRETSRQAIADLHSLGVKTLMLTGDNVHTAEAIASAVGIDDEARGNLLPEDKLSTVESLLTHRKGGRSAWSATASTMPCVGPCGHRIRDGGGRYGHGYRTADVALMDDDLRKIPTFVRLSRATALQC